MTTLRVFSATVPSLFSGALAHLRRVIVLPVRTCPARRLNFPVKIRLLSRFICFRNEKVAAKTPCHLNILKHWQTERAFDPVQLARVSVSAADRPLELLINGSLIQGKSGWEGGEPSPWLWCCCNADTARRRCQATSFSIPRCLYYTHCRLNIYCWLGCSCFCARPKVYSLLFQCTWVLLGDAPQNSPLATRRRPQGLTVKPINRGLRTLFFTESIFEPRVGEIFTIMQLSVMLRARFLCQIVNLFILIKFAKRCK